VEPGGGISPFSDAERRCAAGSKTRYLLTRPGGEPMFLPGLYARTTVDGAPYASCTVCTMEARGIMRYVHNSTLRQPVVVPAAGIGAWLDDDLSVDEARSAVLQAEVSASFEPHPPIAAEQELPW
jgi:putative SOS response-associated peptidase YedK